MGADGGNANCGVLAYGAPHEGTVELYVKLYGSTDAGARAASRSRPLLNRGRSRPEAPPPMPSKTAERKTELGSIGAVKGNAIIIIEGVPADHTRPEDSSGVTHRLCQLALCRRVASRVRAYYLPQLAPRSRGSSAAMELADGIERAGALVADYLGRRQPSQSMQSAAEPMLGRRRGTSKRDEARAAHRFLAVAVCCFVACSAAICMRAGRIAASYLEPVRLLDATP